jgi:hypothetical protein
MGDIAVCAGRILASNGSCRDDGVIDQAMEAAVDALQRPGAEVDIVVLRAKPRKPEYGLIRRTQTTDAPLTRRYNAVPFISQVAGFSKGSPSWRMPSTTTSS